MLVKRFGLKSMKFWDKENRIPGVPTSLCLYLRAKKLIIIFGQRRESLVISNFKWESSIGDSIGDFPITVVN